MYKTERTLWHSKIVYLSDDIDFTGQKPYKARFNSKIFVFSRIDGWKRLYEDIIKELYSINPRLLQDVADGQREFVMSDEPALWSIGNREPAQTYDDSWWTKIDERIYLYTKNNTNKKIEHLRKFFDLYGIDQVELKILLY